MLLSVVGKGFEAVGFWSLGRGANRRFKIWRLEFSVLKL